MQTTTKRKSTTSSHLALNAGISFKTAGDGLSDHSELDGEEHNLVHSSPVKPQKVHATTEVKLFISFML